MSSVRHSACLLNGDGVLSDPGASTGQYLLTPQDKPDPRAEAQSKGLNR